MCCTSNLPFWSPFLESVSPSIRGPSFSLPPAPRIQINNALDKAGPDDGRRGDLALALDDDRICGDKRCQVHDRDKLLQEIDDGGSLAAVRPGQQKSGAIEGEESWVASGRPGPRRSSATHIPHHAPTMSFPQEQPRSKPLPHLPLAPYHRFFVRVDRTMRRTKPEETSSMTVRHGTPNTRLTVGTTFRCRK